MKKQTLTVLNFAVLLTTCILLFGCGGSVYKNIVRGNKIPVEKYFNKEKNDLNAPKWHGNTPLSLAVEHGHEDIINFLISKGADLNARNAAVEKNDLSKFPTCTPIMVAAYYGRGEIIKQMVSKGVDVNARDKNGNTALMWALYGDACFHTKKSAGFLPYLINSNSAKLSAPLLICPRPGVVNLEDNTTEGTAIRKISDFVYYLLPGQKRLLVQYFYNDSLWIGNAEPEDKILGIPTILEMDIQPDDIYMLNYSTSKPGWRVWIDKLQLPETLIN